MELADLCMQTQGSVICEPPIALGPIRRGLSTLNRRQHIFRTVFSAAPDSVPGKAHPKRTEPSPERRLLLKAGLERRQALAILSAAVPALSLPIPAAGRHAKTSHHLSCRG